ncbi:MAG: bifunctional diaminohydroxyphosphoribosylaminopyrimidine deaminase/5-amino-6-(5-phosphoribosylamino)uracil reductase RibD [Saprospiraceae bacterium]|nr:bifunctional diaminohydroxyphosphoribosylaminopyrimidine deaminase/5-amino-6-(5-phosphoribosylamino)uracil reductase RibD [Saprospiraceae bacterium]
MVPTTHERYMRRCFDLALLGAGKVSPNPMVGALLEYKGRIIGEGWHRQFGGPHAEVNCIDSVREDNRAFIPHATLYCSLEPCFHYGKTPPCVDLILREKIGKVVIANLDPNPKVAGQSVEKMRAAGVEVTIDVLKEQGSELNRYFFKWIRTGRPYVILKWAQTADGFIGRESERTPISGPAAMHLVHKWRSEVDAILVGTKTALTDNPRLDIRHYFGKTPLRAVLDIAGKIPAGHFLLDDSTPTLVFGKTRAGDFKHTQFTGHKSTIDPEEIAEQIGAKGCAILLVEGGSVLHEQFIGQNAWDEIRILTNKKRLGTGISAPGLPPGAALSESMAIGDDLVEVFRRVTVS